MFDKNGNPDVMGSRPLTPEQIAFVDDIKADFNALHAKVAATPASTSETQRLFAIARTHLEIACMAAVKAVSRH